MQKTSLFHQFALEIQPISESVTRTIILIFDNFQPKNFKSTLKLRNLYQHTKNQAISLFRSRNITSLKTLQSDWQKEFWPIYQEPDFSRLGFVQKYSK